MPKINKDFADAIGFKSLSNFNDFTIEYSVEGAKIQKLSDQSFRDTCFKCYPIISEAGVDPNTYTSKSVDIKNELRKKFPVKVVDPKKPAVITIKDDDETESVYSEELFTASIKPPKNSPAASPRSSQKPLQKLAQKPAETQTPFPTPIAIQCKRCAENLHDLHVKSIMVANLTRQNQNLTDQLEAKNKLFNQKSLDHIRLQNDYSLVKKELDALKNDKEFTTIMDYQRTKKRRL